jgi:hypothetical protein
MNQQSHSIRAAAVTQLQKVQSLSDLDWLIKESEIVTGSPGRDFVVLGADRPAFHVRLDLGGYCINRIDHTAESQAWHTKAPALAQETLGEAIAVGLLFTAQIH